MTINSPGTPATTAANEVGSSSRESTRGQAEQNRALSQAVRLVNSSTLTSQVRQLSLSLDPTTKMAIAKVVDPSTGEVLDQVPSEDILRLAAYLQAQKIEQQDAQQAAQKTVG